MLKTLFICLLLNLVSSSNLPQIPFVQRARSPSDLRKFHSNSVPNHPDTLADCVIQAGHQGNPQFPRYPCNNFHFHLTLINITIGTPPQQITVSLDSGKNSTFVFSSSYIYNTTDQTLFNTSQSSTYKESRLGIPLQGFSGELNAIATEGHDVYQVGNATFRQMFTAVDEDINAWSGNLDLREVSGSLGLMWNHGDSSFNSDPIRQILKAYNVTKNVYTIWLTAQYPTVLNKESNGIITLGGHNKDKCMKSLAKINFQSKIGRNVVPLEQFKMGSYSSKREAFATFDSGFPVIGLPDSVIKTVFKQLGVTYDWDYGLYKMKFDKRSEDQEMVFKIGGEHFTVKAVDYIFDFILPDQDDVVVGLTNLDNSNQNMYVLGTPFLRQYCITYSIDENSVELSKAVFS